ncbi:MAG: hypothetical protein R3358_01390 [Woeseiaceae bacterium]|nr:hypothetical protein [Woeseiaceae bacterium]
MKRLLILWMLTLLSGTATAQDAVGTALNKCAAIDDDADRLSCYDALAAVLAPSGDEGAAYVPASTAAVATSASTTAAEAAATTAGAAVPLNDEVGKERIQQPSEQERTRYASHVNKCEESQPSGQTYFFMDNGQVWKQSKYRRLNFRDCDFEVEISKGTFGYEMHIPSKDRSIRISRVR